MALRGYNTAPSGSTPKKLVDDVTKAVVQHVPLPQNLNPIEVLRTLLIPKALSDTAKATDSVPSRKTNQDIFDPIAADIPGLRENLPVKTQLPPEERMRRARELALRQLEQANK